MSATCLNKFIRLVNSGATHERYLYVRYFEPNAFIPFVSHRGRAESNKECLAIYDFLEPAMDPEHRYESGTDKVTGMRYQPIDEIPRNLK